MSKSKAMRLILIDGEISEQNNFKRCSRARDDVTFVAMTSSSEEGLELVKTHLPEGVILDLHLLNGSEPGKNFLKQLAKTKLSLRPIVVITTSNQSLMVKKLASKLEADWFFSKLENNYSADLVCNTLLFLRQGLHLKQPKGMILESQTVESIADQKIRIKKRIDIELDLIGIRRRHKGRVYLHDAIILEIMSEESADKTAIEQVALKHRREYGTIHKCIQTAIDYAWNNTTIDDLKRFYTDPISSKRAAPYTSDFVRYYARKIGESLLE